MKKLWILFLVSMMALVLAACGSGKDAEDSKPVANTEQAVTDGKIDEAPLSDAEAWYGTRTYTVREYLDQAPRIMVIINKPSSLGKDKGVESIYIIADDTVTEKKTVPSSNIKSMAEMGEFKDKDWENYILGLKKITLGELAQMSEDDLWEYVGVLETVSETPLDLHVFTDKSGNAVIGEDISDLLDFDNYWDHPQMSYINFPIYDKYYVGYATTSPRERDGYYFLSDEDIMLVMDDQSTPGIAVD